MSMAMLMVNLNVQLTSIQKPILLRYLHVYIFIQDIKNIGLNRILDIWQLMHMAQQGIQGKQQQPKCKIPTFAQRHIYPFIYFLLKQHTHTDL